jgi:hypothetical protein
LESDGTSKKGRRMGQRNLLNEKRGWGIISFKRGYVLAAVPVVDGSVLRIARSSAENTKSAADEVPSKVVILDDGDWCLLWTFR